MIRHTTIIAFLFLYTICISQEVADPVKKYEARKLINSYVSNNYSSEIHLCRLANSIKKCRFYQNCKKNYDTPPALKMPDVLDFTESPYLILKELNNDILDTNFINSQINYSSYDLKKLKLENVKFKYGIGKHIGIRRNKVCLSKPVFTKNREYAILVVGQSKDNEGKNDLLYVFKKSEDDDWVVIKKIGVK